MPPPLEVLDVVMRHRSGSLSDFKTELRPGSDFGQIVVEAFDRGMTPAEWRVVDTPSADPMLVAALIEAWKTCVLAQFAARYAID